MTKPIIIDFVQTYYVTHTSSLVHGAQKIFESAIWFLVALFYETATIELHYLGCQVIDLAKTARAPP